MTLVSSEFPLLSVPSAGPSARDSVPASMRALIERMSAEEVALLSSALRGSERRDEPWEDRTVLLFAGGIAASVALVLAAWIGASGSTDATSLVTWLALSIAGPFLFGLAATLWLVEGSGRVRVRQDQLMQRVVARIALRDVEQARLLRSLHEVDPLPASRMSRSSVQLPVKETAATPLVSSPDMSRYHHPTCPLAADKPVLPFDRSDGRITRRACGVCLS